MSLCIAGTWWNSWRRWNTWSKGELVIACTSNVQFVYVVHLVGITDIYLGLCSSVVFVINFVNGEQINQNRLLIKLHRTVQQQYLRSILNIRWDHFITNDEVLDLANTTDIEITLISSRLRWLGNVARMPDWRPVKALPYGELAEGCRRVGLSFLRFEDTLKDILKCIAVLRS